MNDYFDNRKQEDGSSHRKSHRNGSLRGALRAICSLDSKRGSKLRFRLLCALAVIFLIVFLLARHYYPQNDIDVENGLQNDILGRDKSGRALLLRPE